MSEVPLYTRQLSVNRQIDEGVECPGARVARRGGSRHLFIRISIDDKYSGSMKITAHLDLIGYCKTVSGTTLSSRWTYQVFIMSTRRDRVQGSPGVVGDATCAGVPRS